jgi:GTP-binding protein
LEHELEVYKTGLADKAMMVVLNKADEVSEETGRLRLAELQKAIQDLSNEGQHLELVTVSAKYGLGISKVVAGLADFLIQHRLRDSAAADELAEESL